MEWRVIERFPDYEVREDGVVRRATNSYWGHPSSDRRYIRSPAGMLVQIRTSDRGYLYVRLPFKRGAYKDLLLSRLVCEAWHGLPPSNKHQAAHWDGNVLNCRHGNLRWATPLENSMDQIRHGTTTRGEKSARAKLTSKDVKEIRALIEQGISKSEISRRFNVVPGSIYAIETGLTWSWLV